MLFAWRQFIAQAKKLPAGLQSLQKQIKNHV
jgi:hypothetical protein